MYNGCRNQNRRDRQQNTIKQACCIAGELEQHAARTHRIGRSGEANGRICVLPRSGEADGRICVLPMRGEADGRICVLPMRGEVNGRICGGIRRPCPRRHSVGKDGCRRFPRTHSHLGRRDGQPNPSVRRQTRRACRMCTNIRSHRPGGAPASRCFACSRAGR